MYIKNKRKSNKNDILFFYWIIMLSISLTLACNSKESIPKEEKRPEKEFKKLGTISLRSYFMGGQLIFLRDISRDSVGAFLKLRKQYRHNDVDTNLIVRFDDTLWIALEKSVNECFKENSVLKGNVKCKSETRCGVRVRATDSTVIGSGGWSCGLIEDDSMRWSKVENIISKIYPNSFNFDRSDLE